jgi:hypothetical protein
VRQLLRSMVQDGEVLRYGTDSQTRYTLPDGDHDHHDDHGAHSHHEDHNTRSSWEDDDPDMIVIDFEALGWNEGRAS